jgi:hypothetical protein
MWRVGAKIPLNVYDGDRPVCQCHSDQDARTIADAVNAVQSGSTTDPLLRENASLREQNRRLRADWLAMSAGNQELVDELARLRSVKRAESPKTCRACGGPMPPSDDPWPCLYCDTCLATKSIDQLGRESRERHPAGSF